ncbi:Protein C09G9.1 c, partial [Aphelenchoides avenae]
MHRLNLWDRVQFSVFSSGMFNFGSLVLVVLVKALVPKRLPTLPKSILAAGLSVFVMTSGANYLRYIDSATLPRPGSAGEVRTRVDDMDSSFWSDLFAIKAFRRVRKFRMANTVGQYPAVHDRELFDFITGLSHMPADKPRAVYIAELDRRSVAAVERRFKNHIDSSDGQVCAVIKGPGYHGYRYLSNMA